MGFNISQLDGHQNKVQIASQDGTKTAEVNSLNRLLVDANVARPLSGLVEQYLLLNGTGSDALNVNASAGSPQVFKFEPDANNDVELMQLAFTAETGTIDFGNKFLTGTSALTNGILIELKAGDASFAIGNMQRTSHLMEFASLGGVEMYISGQDIIRAVRALPSGVILKKLGTYGTPDYIKVTIRDNLSGLTSFKCRIIGAKVS